MNHDPDELLTAAVQRDRRSLARLLSLVERGGQGARAVGHAAHRRGVDPAYTVGLTGAPGAGKSTLTSALTGVVRARGDRVAVLAIDPTSPFSGGAILGDRVRMQTHSTDEDVFIRSMATRGHLGGLSLATPQAVRVLEATGWDPVLIETVGVGQIEVDIAGEADTTVVVVNPGWGDSVQANKAGLLEIADVFVINKADRPGADDAERDLMQMMELGVREDWMPPIVRTVATDGTGIEDLAEAIDHHRTHLTETQTLDERRRMRRREELTEILRARMEQRIAAILDDPAATEIETQLLDRELDPYEAADRLLGDLA
ncbi:MAG: methylmalonyl Co-A mutase-associated GTPase MeaB [Actinomycetota bacterium]